jgi:hypothetical protein
MKSIILAGALAVLAGCHSRVRVEVKGSVSPAVENTGSARSIPHETVAVARKPQSEVPPPEVNPAAAVNPLDRDGVIAEKNVRLQDVY